MSMITGCPACGTLFKVVPDQLKISDGWVRCGHCGEVFDAAAHLQAAQDLPEPEPQLPAAEAPTAAPLSPTAEVETDEPVLPEPLPGPPVAQPETPASFLARRDEEPGYPPIDFVRSEVEASALPLDDTDELQDEDEQEQDEEEGLGQVSFVRDARRRAFWQRPLVRAGLTLAGLGLAALLAGQVALHDRDRLAALHPQWRPWLAQACEHLGCTVGPPRRIEAISIDNSAFTRLQPDVYRLSFTVKNQAAQPVAVPSLELTLTDTQDQPLLRRVLGPRELGAAADTIAARADWSSSLAIAVDAAGSPGRVAGYRLLAFYP